MFAQPAPRQQMSSAAGSAMSDQAFAKTAARGGITEVKLGQLAEDKGTTDTVKDFGKRMVNDHSAADEKLKSAASEANMTVPEQPSPQQQAVYDRLSKLSGKAFDRAYAGAMVKDHEQAVAAFRKEAKTGKNQEIKSFAAATLPTLEEHLKLAREMYHSVESGAAKTSATGSGTQR